MSLPGANALSPAPRMTIQRNSSSAESDSIVSPSARHIDFVRALSFSGRLSTTVAISASRWTRIKSVIALVVEQVYETQCHFRHIGDENQHDEQHGDEPRVHLRHFPDVGLRDRA